MARGGGLQPPRWGTLIAPLSGIKLTVRRGGFVNETCLHENHIDLHLAYNSATGCEYKESTDAVSVYRN